MGRDTAEKAGGIFQPLLYGVFGCTVLAAGILGGYQYYLNGQIQAKKDALAIYDNKIGAMPLEEMRRVSNRIKVINQVIKEHASVSTAFRVLEYSIENPITYTRFALSINPTNKTYELSLGATAPSYRAVAQQVDTFNKTTTFKDFIPAVTYDGVSLDPTTGKVSVNFKMPIRIEGKVPTDVDLKLGAVSAQKDVVVTDATSTSVVGTATSTPVTATSTKSTKTTTSSSTSPR